MRCLRPPPSIPIHLHVAGVGPHLCSESCAMRGVRLACGTAIVTPLKPNVLHGPFVAGLQLLHPIPHPTHPRHATLHSSCRQSPAAL